MFLKIPQNSNENTCARVSSLIKLQASGIKIFLGRDSKTLLFYDFWQYLKPHLTGTFHCCSISRSADVKIFSSILTFLLIFWIFWHFLVAKKLMTSACNRWCQHFFYFQPTLNRWFNNYIKLYWYYIVLLEMWRWVKLLFKSMNWFLYDRDLSHEGVKANLNCWSVYIITQGSTKMYGHLLTKLLGCY